FPLLTKMTAFMAVCQPLGKCCHVSTSSEVVLTPTLCRSLPSCTSQYSFKKSLPLVELLFDSVHLHLNGNLSFHLTPLVPQSCSTHVRATSSRYEYVVQLLHNIGFSSRLKMCYVPHYS